ncbi:ABC transporter permease [Paenirhodobacter sp.]|uniref:ABC transporter permease n=1 Tax=Paenirhodobacter sp. TaxID=1965326 RepID=UPI003B3D533A
MTRAILSRLLQAVPVFLVISVLVFAAVHVAPGDPITNSLAGILSQEAIDKIRQEYGLDQSIVVQYFAWLKQLFQLNWGYSLVRRVPVFDLIGPAFLNTLLLTGAAVLICSVFGVLIGIVAGLRRGGVLDRGTMAVVQLAHNLPVFFLGLLLIWVFGVKLRWLPTSGMYDMRGDQGWVDAARHLILPAISAAFVSMLVLARLIRASTIEIMASDHIRTYRSQGFGPAQLIGRHLLRSLAAPIVNMTGLQIGYLMSGVVFIEAVFNWPGIGTLLYAAAAGRDYPVVMAGVMLVTGCYLIINLVTDIILDLLNPRLRANA